MSEDDADAAPDITVDGTPVDPQTFGAMLDEVHDTIETIAQNVATAMHPLQTMTDDTDTDDDANNDADDANDDPPDPAAGVNTPPADAGTAGLNDLFDPDQYAIDPSATADAMKSATAINFDPTAGVQTSGDPTELIEGQSVMIEANDTHVPGEIKGKRSTERSDGITRVNLSVTLMPSIVGINGDAARDTVEWLRAKSRDNAAVEVVFSGQGERLWASVRAASQDTFMARAATPPIHLDLCYDVDGHMTMPADGQRTTHHPGTKMITTDGARATLADDTDVLMDDFDTDTDDGTPDAADLTAWGGGVDESEPHVVRKAPQYDPRTDKICGFLGRDTARDFKVYTTAPLTDYHYCDRGHYDAFALSKAVIDRVDVLDASRVYVHDSRNGDYPAHDGPVIEYSIGAYVDGDDVPGGWQRARPGDEGEYTYVLPSADPLAVHPTLGTNLFERSFEGACEYIRREYPGRFED